MAIGRSFEEHFKKLCMTSPNIGGFESLPRLRDVSDEELDNQLKILIMSAFFSRRSFGKGVFC